MNRRGEAQLVLQVAHEVDDLRLDGDVEGGDGFVADDEVGAGGEGAGDADALALAAAELVGEAAHGVAREADGVHELGDAVVDFAGAAGEAEIVQGLREDVADAHAGVEAAEGVLKDDLDAAAQGAELAERDVVDALAVEEDFAVGWLDEAEDGLGRRCFCRSRFRRRGRGFRPWRCRS